jgi:hypothetical protein
VDFISIDNNTHKNYLQSTRNPQFRRGHFSIAVDGDTFALLPQNIFLPLTGEMISARVYEHEERCAIQYIVWKNKNVEYIVIFIDKLKKKRL